MEKKSSLRLGGYLEALLASCPMAIIANNADGVITFANKEACQLVEREMRELVGENVAIVYESLEAARETNRKIYQQGGAIRDHESKAKTKEGKIIPVRISASLLNDSAGKYNGAIGYFEIYRPWTTAEEKAKARCDELEAKLEELVGLSAPLFELYPGISAAAIAGHLDTNRFDGITSNLLDHLRSMKTNVLIIDLSATLVVDDNIAGQLMKFVRTARLLGTQCTLVGIQTSLAQAMEPMVTALDFVQAFSSMDTATHAAFNRIGFEICKKD
ncbi:STAS domain-containing protein [Chloroflexota bacterium]